MAKLDYSRVSGSPYPAGSEEDRKLAKDQAEFSKRNRQRLGQNIKDVATGRAAVEGVKVIARWATSSIRRTDDRHNKIIRHK